MKENVSNLAVNRGANRVNSILNPKKIQIVRAKKGMTCKDLADLIGVTRQFISGIETGRITINHDRARQIAKSLNTSVKNLFDKNDKEKYFSK